MKYIIWDLPQIRKLKDDYMKTIYCIKDELPDVNWNSIVETKEYFEDEHDLYLLNTTINYLKEQIDEYDPDFATTNEVLTGLIELKKLQYTIRNYLDQILKHSDKTGKYILREINGEWRLQNKQPLPYTPEIVECIIQQGEE